MGLKPIIGTRLMFSTPPATKTSPAPMAIAPAAIWIACMEEPHQRLTVEPPTDCGRPAISAAQRAMFRPARPRGRAAEVHILDFRRIDAGPVDKRLDDAGDEVVRPGAGEGAAIGGVNGLLR
jgi:hypothetical protein